MIIYLVTIEAYQDLPQVCGLVYDDGMPFYKNEVVAVINNIRLKVNVI